jgi:hypothetical protein
MRNLNKIVSIVLKMIENNECEDLTNEELEQISILIHRPTTMGREDAAKFMGVSLTRFHELKDYGIIPEPRKVKGFREKSYYVSDLKKALELKKQLKL